MQGDALQDVLLQQFIMILMKIFTENFKKNKTVPNEISFSNSKKFISMSTKIIFF